MKTPSLVRTFCGHKALRKSPLFGLAMFTLFGASCGDMDSAEDSDSVDTGEKISPVRAETISNNDPPLAKLSDLRKGFPGNAALRFEPGLNAVPPTKFDVFSLQAPVRNQQSRGVCSIFSTIGLMEMLYKKAGLPDPNFSEQYLQWSVKVQEGAFSYTEGSSDYYNLLAINDFGIPLESDWPYEGMPWTTADDPECTGESSGLPTKCYTNGDPPLAARMAPMYKLPPSRFISADSIKNVIYEKKVGVVVGLDFFYQAWNHRRSTLPVNATYFSRGYVLYPNDTDIVESHKHQAGHSVQLIGWDNNLQVQKIDAMGNGVVDASGKPVKEKGFFLFKNSWGTSAFGATNSKAPGYGWISFGYINEYGSANTSDPPTLPRG